MLVAIPKVDRGRTDPRNLVGILTDIKDNKVYKIAFWWWYYESAILKITIRNIKRKTYNFKRHLSNGT